MKTSMSQAGLDHLHQAMAARIAKGDMPGIVTLVARGDEAHVDAIGTMEFGGDQPMRRDTVFRITSMTKPILATATMLLVEEGAVTLDEPVDRLLPELADRRVLRRIDGPLDDTVPADRPITVEDLLTFRMGHGMIVEPTFDPPFPIVQAAHELQLVMGPPDPRTPHHPDEWIRRFGTLPLTCQPGERWQYNTGTLVLGVLLARAVGQPLDAFMRTRLFEPLGMKDTGFSMPAEHVDRLPSQYHTDFRTGKANLLTLSGPGLWTRPPVFPSGSAGLLSTVDDYMAFARLLLNKGVHRGGRILSERSVEMMTANHLTSEQIAGAGMLLSPGGWGLGMTVTVAPDSVSPVPGRYGWDGGYGTTWFNDPVRRLVAIAMTQNDGFMFNGTLPEFQELAAQAWSD
jgi:CubicO group peptidase (beta-lactamase class C family)